MAVAIQVDGVWIEVGGEPVSAVGREFRAEWLAGQSDAELAVIGLTRGTVAEASEPDDLFVLGSTIADVNGVPTRQWTTRDFTVEELSAREASLAATAAILAAEQP